MATLAKDWTDSVDVHNSGILGEMYADYEVLPAIEYSDPDSDAESESETKPEREHTYRALKPDEIRLLILNPGEEDDPIECYLEHYSVNAPKFYMALSYVWGDTLDPRCITLDGCNFPVSRNLESFLRSFRRWNDCCCIWIDQISINQVDIPERNSQIRLMKRVYEGADQIIIWLGDPGEHVESALVRINQTYNKPIIINATSTRSSSELNEPIYIGAASSSAESAFDDDGLVVIDNTRSDISEDDKPEIPGDNELEISCDNKVKIFCDNKSEIFSDDTAELSAASHSPAEPALKMEDLSPEDIAGIQDLLTRPWWTRIWVYQEATAPSRGRSLVHCGRKAVYLSHLLDCNRDLWNLNAGRLGSRTALTMDEYSNLRREYHRTGESDYLRLADLLPTLRVFNSTNPRDKLYALIPTSIDGGDLLDVDYSRSAEDVYIDAACSILKSDGNLNFLGHCTGSSEESSFSLPSWVPDWTVNVAPDHLYKRSPSGRLYSACANLPADFHVNREEKTLNCSGWIFDTVKGVTDSNGDICSGPEIVEIWTDWLTVQEFATGNSVTPYTQSVEEVFLRTLVADCERIGMDIGSRIPPEESTKDIMDAISLGIHGTFKGPHSAFTHRKLILTDRGYLGLTAKHVLPGDTVVVLKGGNCPMVLRVNESDSHFSLIGEAYIHGIMDGEAIADLGEKKTRTFTIS
jgi:hypothetical protein